MLKKVYKWSRRSIYKFLLKNLNNFFISPNVDAINHLPVQTSLGLIDIGAAGEIEPRWRPYSKFIKYFGFEPDKRSNQFSIKEKEKFLNYKVFTKALSEAEKEQDFYFCKKPEVSSLYRPNSNFLKNFPNHERFQIVEKQILKTVTLDSLNIVDNDFIKIDVQGGELNILKGSPKTLENIMGLEIEIEFLQVYENQPLFGQICEELAKKGFQFIDFVNLARWERNKFNSFGQCIFGDGLFLKTPETLDLENISIQKLCSYITILIVYRRYDLIELTLELMDDKLENSFSDFKSALKKAKSRNNFTRNLIKNANKIAPIFGNNYRFHLIY